MHGTTELTTAEDIGTLLTNGMLAKPLTYKQEEGVLAASALVPEGYRLEHLPWERAHDVPFAKRADRTFADTDSLVAYVKAHAVPGKSAVYVNPGGTGWNAYVEAILDDHAVGADGAAGWGDHRASVHLPQSVQLRTWVGQNDKYLDQIAFAEFIEANLSDIIEPAAADLLEVVTTLQQTNKVAFSSAVRLDNGQAQITYHEDISATAGKSSTLDIPTEFKIAVPVFEFGTRYAMKARLRYRVRDQKLVLAYVLERLDDIVRNALATGDDSVLNTLRAALDAGDDVGVPVYLGSAGSAPRYAGLVTPDGKDAD